MQEASNISDIHYYDWPSDAHNQKWRHITNYSIIELLEDNETGGHVGIKTFTKNKSCKLNGYLLPRPSYVNRPALRQNFTVSYHQYSAIIDYSVSQIKVIKACMYL